MTYRHMWIDRDGDPAVEYPPGSNQIIYLNEQLLRLIVEKFGTDALEDVMASVYGPLLPLVPEQRYRSESPDPIPERGVTVGTYPDLDD
jgi:hypothetical protein